MTLIFLIIGFGLLVKGSQWLVDGASSLALRFKITPMVIGLTVVAFGTSAPELVVSITSALNGNTDIALGNVVGSNIVNVLLILGLSAIIYPLQIQKNTTWKEIPFSLLGVLVVLVLGLQTQFDVWRFNDVNLNSSQAFEQLNLSHGLILLFFFVIFIYYTFSIASLSGEQEQDVEIK